MRTTETVRLNLLENCEVWVCVVFGNSVLEQIGGDSHLGLGFGSLGGKSTGFC